MKMNKISLAAFTAVAITAAIGCAPRAATTTAPTGPTTVGTAEPGVIPAGTTLAFRTNENIITEQPQSGVTYEAEVAREVVDGTGNVLIPSGSPARLVVLQAREGGTVQTAQMELGVHSITVNGQTHLVSTFGERQEAEGGIGRTERTAQMVGGGAALGALVGAVAGGASGAAAGAAVGAAGGAAAQVLTQGKEIRVPAETVLQFRLQQPLVLQGFRG